MSISPEDLDRWFTYHPPTDVTSPKYRAIGYAQEDCAFVFHSAPGDADRPGAFVRVTTSVRAFANAILANAPDSDERTAAIRCLRLARNGINEILSGAAGRPDTGWDQKVFDASILRLVEARWQANAAIACGGR